MSAYGPGADYLRSFQSKCRAVSATRRKALEEATAALGVDTDPPPQHTEGPLATVMTWSNPPVERSPSFGHYPASGTASKHSSARVANSRGCIQQRCKDGLAARKRPSVSSPNGSLAGTSPPCHTKGFAPRIGAAAADACASNPTIVVGTGVHDSLHSAARRLPSARLSIVVADHRGGSRGHAKIMNAPSRVRNIRLALKDLAGVGGAACRSSPVEQVLARRKRRRRANFGVSSALCLSTSTEEVPLSPMPEPRPLVTRGDDEHDAAAPGLCDELESLQLSHISWDSSGGWKSDVAAGFRHTPEGTVEQAAPLDGVEDLHQALNEHEIPSSSTDGELEENRNGVRDGFADSTSARSSHREGIPLEAPPKGMLTQVGVDATSCSGLGCARCDGIWPRARAKQGKLGPFEGCRGDNKDGDGDSCWNQEPLREGLGRPNAAADFLSYDFDQDAPPSPLPSPPVPSSHTARRGTSIVRRRPPSRVLSASDSTLLQQCQDDSRGWGAPDSKNNRLCAETLSTPGAGNEATMVTSRTAENEASGQEKVLSPCKDPFPERRAQDPIVGVRGDSGIDEGMVGQLPQTGRGSSPQPHLKDWVGPPETALLRDTAAPTSDYVPPKTQRRGAKSSPPASPSSINATSCDGCKASPTSSPSAQTAHAAPDFGGEAGTQAKTLHGRRHHGVDMAILWSPSRRTSNEASSRTDRNPRQSSKTTAVLILQRWLRCAPLRRERTSGPEGGAAQRTRKLNETKKIEQFQSVKSSSSTTRHHPREARIEDAAHVHAGASPSETNPAGQEEAVLLFPEAETLLRDAVPPYWEDYPIFDQSHALPRYGIVVTSAVHGSLRKAPVSSSQAFDRTDDLSHDHPMKKPGSGTDNNNAAQGCDSCQDDDTIRLPCLVAQEKTVGMQEKTVGMDKASTKRSSTVLFSVPSDSPSPAISLSQGLSPPVVLRRKVDDHLQPSERENNTNLYGNPTSGERGCNGTTDYGRCILSSCVSHQGLVARDMPCYSVAALGRRAELADVRFKAGAGYGLTVQEACFRPSSRPGSDRAPYSFRSPFVDANGRKSCQSDVVVSTAVEIPVMKSASHYHQQEDEPSVLLAGAFARQLVTIHGDELGANPLLHPWGIGNPLLTRPPGTISGTFNGGGAAYG